MNTVSNYRSLDMSSLRPLHHCSKPYILQAAEKGVLRRPQFGMLLWA